MSSQDGKMRLFDRSNGQVLQTFMGHKVSHTGPRSRPAFNRGEGAVIAGDEEGRIWSWNVLDGKPLAGSPLPAHKRAVTTVITHPNGKEMVSCSLGEQETLRRPADSVRWDYQAVGQVMARSGVPGSCGVEWQSQRRNILYALANISSFV